MYVAEEIARGVVPKREKTQLVQEAVEETLLEVIRFQATKANQEGSCASFKKVDLL